MATQTLEKKQGNNKQQPAGWRPLNLWTEMDRMREMMGQWFADSSLAQPFSEFISEYKSQPFLNMFTEGDNLVVEAEIPGFDKKDIQVNVCGDILSIQAERTEEKEETKEGYFMRERRQGSMSRSIRLPMEVETDKIKALSRDGVLRVEMPMTEPSRQKAVTIDVK